MDSLKLFLDTEISLDAVVPHKDAVIALASGRLADKAGMSYEHARDALFDREKLGSTALGRGVAMPHAMSRHCARAAAVLIGLSSPVNFDAPDDADVDVVLALIWPYDRPREFLELSATASRVLTDPAMLHLVRRSAAPDLIRRSIYFNVQASRSRASEPADQDGRIMELSGQPRWRGAEFVLDSSLIRGAAHGS